MKLPENDLLVNWKSPGQWSEKPTDSPKEFERALENGYEIEEYYKHDGEPRFTVVLAKGLISKTFSNISQGKLSSAFHVAEKDIETSWNRAHVIHSFETALARGYRVAEYRHHDKDNLYSVKLQNDDHSKIFTKITKRHLASALGVGIGDVQKGWAESEPFSASHQNPKEQLTAKQCIIIS